MNVKSQIADLGNRLLSKAVFSHPVEELRLIETHISWIILTGQIAYKIKKPVRFDFVDYSTPQNRKHFCELEFELNRRFADELYLGVVSIQDLDGQLKIADQDSADQNVIDGAEYAVKMRQFPQHAIVAECIDDPSLSEDVIAEFGTYIAEFHSSVDISESTRESVQPECIIRDAHDNFPVLKELLHSGERWNQIARLESWTKRQSKKLKAKFAKRLEKGWVRRCHGDMHLKNIIQWRGRLIAFDGIEFNESFQWIDVLSEIAFPVMDFFARNRGDLAWRLLNSYLESTGDYEDLDVLRFYLVYRALVRAKVTGLNPKNDDAEVRAGYVKEGDDNPELAGPWDKYLNTAMYFAFEMPTKLSITHGLSGSGKSTIAMAIIESESGIRIRSDVERHRLAAEMQSSSGFEESEKYSTEMTERVYRRLVELAWCIINSGFSAYIDATFLSQQRRKTFQNLAHKLNTAFEIIDCDADYKELCRRITHRGPDPSEATIEVLEMQRKVHEPLTDEERRFVR